ncbi:MAG TPA: hypothetical protein VGD17_07470 [Chitinophagaceae bacterium]
MLIAFVHNNKSFLPETTAYTRFFTTKGIACEAVWPEQLHQLKPDVAWHFMGTDHSRSGSAFKIHEYTSASIPPAAALKNLYKRFFNAKPDHRLFLNEYVRNAFSFHDGVPFGYRDMGVNESWLELSNKNIRKEYDFVYAGEIKHRNINKLLDVFATGNLRDRSILVVSKEYGEEKKAYSTASNIFFEGPVAHDAMPFTISSARFAINFMPDKIPFNNQTSTKLLEYAACRIPVITSDYNWVRNFKEQFGGKYFFISNDMSNLTWENITSFEYAFPDLRQWTWEHQITRSGIMDVLATRFPEINQPAF